jgi:hypothetical protein
MQILIDTGKRQGIVDLVNKRFPSWLDFMKDWSATDIEEYCQKKKWKATTLSTIEYSDSYFIHDWD